MIKINDYEYLKAGDYFINKSEIGNGGDDNKSNVIPPNSVCEITEVTMYDDIRTATLSKTSPFNTGTIVYFKRVSSKGNKTSGFFYIPSHNSNCCYMAFREKNLKLLNI